MSLCSANQRGSTGLRRFLKADLLRLALGPGCRRERFDFGDLGHRQACEQILQTIKWVETMPPATTQQGVDHRATFASLRMPDEQKITFSERTGPNGILD
jgi:hypothetical protein